MVYHLQQTQPPTIPDGIAMPENWRAIILRALAKQPEARWQSAYEFASALASELPGDPRLGLQSGAQMMVSFARSLINQAPLDSETIRVKGAALGPMMWTPPRLTDISNESAPAAGRAPHISAPRVASNPAASELPPTVNERPAPNVAPPTTFSASSGAIVQPAPPKGRHKLMLPISLIATVLVATGVTIGAARLIRSASSNDVAIDATAVVPDADKLAHAAPPDAMEVAADAPSDAAEVAVVDASVIVDASIPSDARVIEGTKVAKDGSKSTTPAVRGTGKLAVYVTPWAVVWLDGKKLAQTPLDPMVVTAGRHRIRLVNEDAGKDESFTITITAEQTTTIRRAW